MMAWRLGVPDFHRRVFQTQKGGGARAFVAHALNEAVQRVVPQQGVDIGRAEGAEGASAAGTDGGGW